MLIAHLYSDLLNLYGNDGNIKMLEKKLTSIGIDVSIVRPTVNDEMDFENYDLIYMGSGTEENLKIAINDMERNIEKINRAIENEKYFLITGNSLDIFGKELEGDTTMKGLGIFNYTSKLVPRIKKDVIRKANFLTGPILGYENHNYILEGNDNLLWEDEGVQYKNFYGTYLEGPILVRNPEFCKFFISKLVNDDSKLQKLNMDLEFKAYDNFRTLLNCEASTEE